MSAPNLIPSLVAEEAEYGRRSEELRADMGFDPPTVACSTCGEATEESNRYRWYQVTVRCPSEMEVAVDTGVILDLLACSAECLKKLIISMLALQIRQPRGVSNGVERNDNG